MPTRYRARPILAGWMAVLSVLGIPEAAMSGTVPRSAGDAAKQLHALFATEWDYETQWDPTRASALGDYRWNDRWPERTPASLRSDRDHRAEALEKLKKIDRASLSPSDQVNYDFFRRLEEEEVEEYSFHWFLVPLDQRDGIQTANLLADVLRFDSVKNYEDWTARLRSFSAYLDQTMALMREGTKERIVHPRVIMERVPAQIDKQIVTNPEASGFFKPFRNFPAAIPATERARLVRDAKAAIANQVVPSFRRFKKFFVEEYLPACFDNVGIWQTPRGEAMYRFFVRKYTTTPLTPAEIHAIGLREVNRISGEMARVMQQTGFQGSRADFFRYLRTDPKFHYNTPQELLEAYRATAKRIDPNLTKLFRLLPRLPYGVEPIADSIAPDTTAAYYREPPGDGTLPGTFMVNLYKPEARPKWEMMALSLHEAVPGHHLQIALAMEQQGLPNFRRYGYVNAFGEGWGLYAESLGEDMGLYDDPYSKFGELTYDMWRAVRLVVDTGMHEMRWSRQKAIDYFLENAPKTELDVTNEIDRYIAWPGQALAYKIGQLKFKELRERARRELGAKFDLREFHEVVLKEGTVPLDILEQQVDAWIASKRSS
ncbi:MAG: DUF885 family protein [Terriglobia bacterium]